MKPSRTQPYRVALLGANGRMGKAITQCLDRHPSLILGAALGRVELAHLVTAKTQLDQCDLVIDFTTADAQATIATLLEATKRPLPLITGVTALTESHFKWIDQYAQRCPVFWSANFSIGIALLKRLATLSAALLGEDFDAEIFELHHRDKLDAPSGTAKVLAESVRVGKQKGGAQSARISHQPLTPRDPNIVQVSAGRGGGVFGDHTIFFLGKSERIELKHSALNRQVFAEGALRAAVWCLGQPPGRYTMDDLLEE